MVSRASRVASLVEALSSVGVVDPDPEVSRAGLLSLVLAGETEGPPEEVSSAAACFAFRNLYLLSFMSRESLLMT